MHKTIGIWLLAASILVVGGLLAFVLVMSINRWDFSKLNISKFQNDIYPLADDFQNISINTKTADVVLAPSEDETGRVVVYEQERLSHTVSVENGTLKIAVDDTREWYEHIGIVWDTPKITVYLPKSEYATLVINGHTGDIEIPAGFSFESIDVSNSTGNVKSCASASGRIAVRTSTGSISLNNGHAGALDLSMTTGKVFVRSFECRGEIKVCVSTGDVMFSKVTCQNLVSDGSTGDVRLEHVIAQGKMSIERSTGDIMFVRSDAAELWLKTSTGDVEGSLLSEKIFFPKSDTGDVELPKTMRGGRCEITTTTGDIEIDIVRR